METTDQTMLLKRTLACISAVIVLVAFFLPWLDIEGAVQTSLVKITTLPTNNMDSGWGWMWIIFIIVLADVLVTSSVRFYSWLQLIAAMASGILLAVWFGNPPMIGGHALQNTNGIGVYLAIIGTIGLVLITLIDVIQQPAKNIKTISLVCFAVIFFVINAFLSPVFLLFFSPSMDEMFGNSDTLMDMEKMASVGNQILIGNTIGFLVSAAITFTIVYFLIYKKLKKKYQH